MEFSSCDFCGNPFIKGSGHTCWCSECSKGHPMCDPCYKKHLKSGEIKDTPGNRNNISESNLKKMT